MRRQLQRLWRRTATETRRRLQRFHRSSRFWQIGLFVVSFLVAIASQLWYLAPSGLSATSNQIGIVNQFIPNSEPPGVNSVYRLTLRNSSGAAVTITSLSHTLPSSPGVLEYAAAAPTLNTCGSTVVINQGSYPGTPGSFSLTGGTIPTGSPGQCIIEIPVRGFSAGNHIDTILGATPPGKPDGDLFTSIGSNPDPTSATLQVQTATAVTISKAFAPNTIPGDGRSTVTITLTNPNTYALTGSASALIDTLPAGAVVDTRVGAPSPTTTCSTGTVNILGGGTGLELAGGTIPASSNCRITFPVTSPTGGVYANSIPASSLNTVNRITNSNTASASLSVQTTVNIAKAFSSGTLDEGETTTLTITITNGGGQLDNSSLTDNLPSPLLVAPTPNAVTTCAGGSVNAIAGASSFSLSGGTIPGSNPSTNAVGQCTISLTVRADPLTTGNLTGTTQSVTNTIPASALGNTQGRTNPNPATANATIRSALVVTKSYSNNLAPGSTTQVTISIQNRSSAIAATGVQFNDTLPGTSPNNMIVATSPNPSIGANCGGASVFNPIAGANSVSFSNGTIPANTTCTLKFDVTTSASTPTGTNFDNVIANNSLTNNEGLDSDGVTGTEGRVSVVSRVAIAKSFNANPVRRGFPSTLTITITNNRRSISGVPESLTSVAITDALPANLQVATTPNLVNTCNGSISGATSGSTTISLSNGSINPTSSCNIKVDVIEIDTNFFSPGNATPRVYPNITSGFSNAEGEPATNASANLTVISPLGGSTDTTKNFQSSQIAANGISTVTIQLSNSLSSPLTGVTFPDTWAQANTIVATPNNLSTTCTSGSVSQTGTRSIQVTGVTVPAQVGGTPGICTVIFDVQMDATGSNTFVNNIPTGTITTDQGFTNSNNVTATLTRVTTNLTINKNISPAGVAVGDPAVLTITVANPASGIPVTKMGFTDVMPAGMIIFPVPNATTTCSGGSVSATSNTNTFVLSGASLGANTSCTVSVNITLNVAATRINTLGASSVNTKEGVTNPAAAAASLNALPALTVTKNFAPTSIAGGGVSQLTLTITNAQTSNQLGGPLTGLTMTDNLPANVVVAPTPTATTTCTSGTITASPGASSITVSGASLNIGSSCQIQVNVTSGLAGSYQNQIASGDVDAQLQVSIGGGPTDNSSPSNIATLTVTSTVQPPQIMLIKRITAVNQTAIATVILDTPEANNAKWPSNFLQGEVNVTNVRPSDEIEYTIYFLNSGLSSARNAIICDRILPNQTFVVNTFNGKTPTDGGIADNLGIALAIGPSSPSFTDTLTYLTNTNDPPDRGEFFPVNTLPSPNRCNVADNPNGLVMVNITRASGPTTIPNATSAGNPVGSYGFIRFRTKVD